MGACSCVIVNYNDAERSERLGRTLASYDAVELVVIVDNCSTDGSLDRLRSKFEQEEAVHVLASPKNGGYGFGNNLGVRYCMEHVPAHDGRHLVLIANPDTMLTSDAVDSMIDCMDKRADAIGCAPLQLDARGALVKSTAWKVPSAVRHAADDLVILRTLLGPIYYPRLACDGKPPMRVGCLAGALLMVDAERFCGLGAYHESMFLFCEETSLGVRAERAGLAFYLLRDCEYIHEHSTSISRAIGSYMHKYRILAASREFVLDHDYQVKGTQRVVCKCILGMSLGGAYAKACMWKLVSLVRRQG